MGKRGVAGLPKRILFYQYHKKEQRNVIIENRKKIKKMYKSGKKAQAKPSALRAKEKGSKILLALRAEKGPGASLGASRRGFVGTAVESIFSALRAEIAKKY